MGFGWGTAVGWLFDRFPGRNESLRNKIYKVERKMIELLKKKPFTDSDSVKYEQLADKLRKLNQIAKNN
jgi:hypothetical protein